MTTQVLNTLFVQTQGTYLRLDHDTVCVEVEGSRKLQVPLHHLGGVALFGNVLISPFLLHRCAEDGREVAWFAEHGRFKGRLLGPVSGNVLLRRAQHAALDDAGRTLVPIINKHSNVVYSCHGRSSNSHCPDGRRAEHAGVLGA